MKKINIKSATLVALAALTCASYAAPITYTWVGGTDLDWTESLNWDGGAIPVNEQGSTGLSFLDPGSKIVFNAATVPTLNVPAFGGVWNPQNTPRLELTSGGTLNISLVVNNSRGISSTATRDVFTVGGGASAVTLNFNFLSLNSLNTTVNGISTYRIGANGTFNLSADLENSIKFGRTAGRPVVFAIDGGTVNIDEEVLNLTAFSGSYIDFTAADGSLTAKFGSDFADIAAVNGAIGDSFRSSNGGTVSALDNGNGTFTVIPEPATLGLISIAGLGLLAFRRRCRN